jgi:hypothetical protein
MASIVLASRRSIKKHSNRGEIMATWQEIKSFVSSKYTVSEVGENLLRLDITYTDDNDRTQMLFIERLNDAKIAFVSPIVDYTPENAVKLLENNDSVYGLRLIQTDQPFLALMDPQDMATLDAEEINVDLAAMADELEKELFGGDKF